MRAVSFVAKRRLGVSVGALGLAGALLLGCNMAKLTADQTAGVLKVAAPALQQESDVEFARLAAPGQLKTVEGFLLATPNNKILIGILAEGYCSYTFGFVEDEIEELEMTGREEEAAPLARRATGLYLRCTNYGLRLLGKSWEKALYGDVASFEKKVKKAGKGDVPGMFWVALGLASSINLNKDDIEIVSYLPKARMLFERVAELDPKYYNAGADMALGMIYTAAGAAMGGNPEKGKEHFERAIKLTEGKFLMPKVLMGYAYGTITQNRKLFHDTLVEVLGTDPAINPGQRLANELAHIRARRYLAHEDSWF